MNAHQAQIDRILNKLRQAKAVDPDYRVFGAASHKYEMNPPASVEEVEAFEAKYGVEIPGAYRAFVLRVGNGGPAFRSSGAGPFYGVYPLGWGARTLIGEEAIHFLKKPCILHPNFTAEAWEDFVAWTDDDDLPDEVFDQKEAELWSGLLPLGSQGCAYLHALVLTGPYRGRIVNLDHDYQKPVFCFEENFLEWYERWLDEIISGDLLQPEAGWFGYVMGGTDASLASVYFTAVDERTQRDALVGLLRKKEVEPAILDALEEEYTRKQNPHKDRLLQIMARHDYPRAKAHLQQAGSELFHSVLKYLLWYAKPHLREWRPYLEERVPNMGDPVELRFSLYLMEHMAFDYSQILLPFAEHEHPEMRKYALEGLAKLENKQRFFHLFKKAAQEEVPEVVEAALQALNGLREADMLTVYKEIALRFEEKETFVFLALRQRLKEYGLTLAQLKDLDVTHFHLRMTRRKGERWFDRLDE